MTLNSVSHPSRLLFSSAQRLQLKISKRFSLSSLIVCPRTLFSFDSVAHLLMGFGDSVCEHILVILTKKDRVDEEELEKRIEYARQTMGELGIGSELVLWQNKDLDDTTYLSQFHNLSDARNNTPPVATEMLQDLNTRIQERAEFLQRDQDPQIVTKWIDENYVEPRQELEEYEESYVNYESRRVCRIDHYRSDFNSSRPSLHSDFCNTTCNTTGDAAAAAAGLVAAGIVALAVAFGTHTESGTVTHYDNKTRHVQREVEIYP